MPAIKVYKARALCTLRWNQICKNPSHPCSRLVTVIIARKAAGERSNLFLVSNSCLFFLLIHHNICRERETDRDNEREQDISLLHLTDEWEWRWEAEIDRISWQTFGIECNSDTSIAVKWSQSETKSLETASYDEQDYEVPDGLVLLCYSKLNVSHRLIIRLNAMFPTNKKENRNEFMITCCIS